MYSYILYVSLNVAIANIFICVGQSELLAAVKEKIVQQNWKWPTISILIPDQMWPDLVHCYDHLVNFDYTDTELVDVKHINVTWGYKRMINREHGYMKYKSIFTSNKTWYSVIHQTTRLIVPSPMMWQFWELRNFSIMKFKLLRMNWLKDTDRMKIFTMENVRDQL